MLTAVSSKREGPGCTTLSLVLAYSLSRQFNRKVCLVDLRNNNDVKKILQLETFACVDNLLSQYGVNSKLTTLEENTVEHNGVSVIPGVTSRLSNYLDRKSKEIKKLLEELDKLYDVVIIDITDGDLLEALLDLGTDIEKISILEQNRLVIEEYQKEMRDDSMRGLMIVNKVDERVWPKEQMFRKHFKDLSIFTLPYSDTLKTTINRNGLKFSEIMKTRFYSDFMLFCSSVNGIIEQYNNSRVSDIEQGISLDSILEKPERTQQKVVEKKGFFSSLFNNKKGGFKR